MGKYYQLPREVQYRSSSGFCVARKIDKDHYQNSITGEIGEYQHHEKRTDNIQSLKRTFDEIELTIKANFLHPENTLWVTFTYRWIDGKPMTDSHRLYLDFKKFRARFFRRLEKDGVINPKWVYVVEPQASGAWHIHMLLDLGKPLFVPNKDVADLWGQGFTKTRRMKEADNVAAYLSAYLTSMKSRKGEKKKSRLSFYPTGMQIWRHSRNCPPPQPEILTPEEAEEKRRASMLSLVVVSRRRIVIESRSGFSVIEAQRSKYRPLVDDLDGTPFLSDSRARQYDRLIASAEVRALVADADKAGKLDALPGWVVDWVQRGIDTRPRSHSGCPGNRSSDLPGDAPSPE